jgi:para-nitrobenzyl esterase
MKGSVRHKLVWVTCFVATTFFHPGLLAHTTADLELNISSGRIIGVVEEGIRVFRGIPYAAPPVGELRWAAPQAALKW